MAPVTLYSLSIPTLIRYLTNTSAILKKGEQHADEKGISHDTLINTSLAPDMKPLSYQIQRLSDSAKGVATRLGGQGPVVMEDTETTFAQLQSRIQRTIDVLKKVDPAAMNGKEDDEVVMKTPEGDIKFAGHAYLVEFALPNFFFHVTTTYAILRHSGVQVGKKDYLGST